MVHGDRAEYVLVGSTAILLTSHSYLSRRPRVASTLAGPQCLRRVLEMIRSAFLVRILQRGRPGSADERPMFRTFALWPHNARLQRSSRRCTPCRLLKHPLIAPPYSLDRGWLRVRWGLEVFTRPEHNPGWRSRPVFPAIRRRCNFAAGSVVVGKCDRRPLLPVSRAVTDSRALERVRLEAGGWANGGRQLQAMPHVPPSARLGQPSMSMLTSGRRDLWRSCGRCGVHCGRAVLSRYASSSMSELAWPRDIDVNYALWQNGVKPKPPSSRESAEQCNTCRF
jgi:hypothetical protein